MGPPHVLSHYKHEHYFQKSTVNSNVNNNNNNNEKRVHLRSIHWHSVAVYWL